MHKRSSSIIENQERAYAFPYLELIERLKRAFEENLNLIDGFSFKIVNISFAMASSEEQ